MDYASFLYGDSCHSNLYKLENVQNQAEPRRFIGSFIKFTPIHVISSELSLQHLFFRRNYSAGKFYLKSLLSSPTVVYLLDDLLPQMPFWKRKNKPSLILSHEYSYLKDVRIHCSQNLEMFGYRSWVSYIDLKTNINRSKPSKKTIPSIRFK